MAKSTSDTIEFPALTFQGGLLSDFVRTGFQRMLTQAIEAEVTAWIDSHEHLTDNQGHR